MSVRTKKQHIDTVAKISWHGGLYVVPVEAMERYKLDSEIKYTTK